MFTFGEEHEIQYMHQYKFHMKKTLLLASCINYTEVHVTRSIEFKNSHTQRQNSLGSDLITSYM